MRVIGVLVFVLAGAATAYCTQAIYRQRRPRDVLFGVLAPFAMVIALTGLLLAFVPDFFG